MSLQSSAEILLFDINKPYMFKEWFEKLCLFISTCDYAGDTMCALRKGHLDDYVLKLRITGNLMHVAPGAQLGQQRYPEGLNGDQYAQLFPPEHVPAAQAAVNSKYRQEYTQRAGRCIAGILSRMVDNTRRFLESEDECRDAIDSRDLVAFVHYLKTRGLVGTRNKEEACHALELKIGNRHESTLLKDENGDCDMIRYGMSWRDHQETLTQLGSTMSTRVIVNGFINGLPEEYNLMKGPILANPPITLLNAIKYFSDMVIQQHVALDDCGAVFGVVKTKNRKRSEREEAEEGDASAATLKMCATLRTEIDAMAIDLADAKNTIRRIKGRSDGAGGRGNAGRGTGSKGGGGANDYFARTECNDYKDKRACDYESRTGRPCKFAHSGSNAKRDGIIKPVKFAETKK